MVGEGRAFVFVFHALLAILSVFRERWQSPFSVSWLSELAQYILAQWRFRKRPSNRDGLLWSA